MDFKEGEVLYFDKPLGWTSFKVVGHVRYHLDVSLRQFLYRSEDSIRTTSTKCRMEREMVHQMSSDILNA